MNIIFSETKYPASANVLYDNIEDAINCKTFDIEIVQDPNTGLVYNRKFDQKTMEYNENYHSERTFSNSYKNYLSTIKDVIEKYFIKSNVLEIGCGDGTFLEYLSERGFDIEGMDPSYQGNNKKIKKEYYTENSKKVYDGIILRHVIEHIQNPYNFLYNLKKINKDHGLIYIEVPNLDYINKNNSFFDIYYEHVNYFRMTDLKNMFDNILETGICFDGQYMYIVAELGSFKTPKKTDDFIFDNNIFTKLNNSIDIIKKSISKNIIWGCSLKGVIFSIFLYKNNIKVDYFVDISPYKQNKYMPIISNYDGYGKIISFDKIEKNLDNNTNIFIMNSNYEKEIKEMTNNKFNYIVL